MIIKWLVFFFKNKMKNIIEKWENIYFDFNNNRKKRRTHYILGFFLFFLSSTSEITIRNYILCIFYICPFFLKSIVYTFSANVTSFAQNSNHRQIFVQISFFFWYFSIFHSLLLAHKNSLLRYYQPVRKTLQQF